MRVLVIGATGTIGREVVKNLGGRHEVVAATRSTGPLRVDIADSGSIENLFREAGAVDAVVCAAGAARFGPMADLTDDDFRFCLENKLMGQVNLVRIGRRFIRDNGSFTLTSGVLAKEPMPGSTAISLVNAGIEGFVRAAALELERSMRVNVVSPVWVKETLVALGRDPSPGMASADVARAYAACVEGTQTGAVVDVREV